MNEAPPIAASFRRPLYIEGNHSTTKQMQLKPPHGISAQILLLSIAVSVTGLLCNVATFSHGSSFPSRVVVLATLLTLGGCLPPLWLPTLLSHAPASQIGVTLWRLGILLPAILVANGLEGVERKYFVVALLACYLVALPVESWLLIHQVKRHRSGPR